MKMYFSLVSTVSDSDFTFNLKTHTYTNNYCAKINLLQIRPN